MSFSFTFYSTKHAHGLTFYEFYIKVKKKYWKVRATWNNLTCICITNFQLRIVDHWLWLQSKTLFYIYFLYVHSTYPLLLCLLCSVRCGKILKIANTLKKYIGKSNRNYYVLKQNSNLRIYKFCKLTNIMWSKQRLT